ncbi:FkbM family methyltransferase [Rhodovarius crocodyli]|uniref:FkbM family methyltransferase n=1 Tax=Rhodovarius crocodyli TaxID=1979269 RepID=A0A437MIQ1_9PROT|nr:FkbM family methyltransferase [Rhodovarius crocodyli]RVT97483.1 FkbM family methyltransferase [Rhodovarius crocodyli]
MTTSRELLVEALDAARIAQFSADVVAELNEAAANGRLLIVGSAALPRKIATAVRAAGGQVAALMEFDARFWGQDVHGLPVLPPEEALERAGEDPIALVGIWSPDHIHARTAEWLAAKGITRVYPVQAAFWAWGDKIGPHYQFGTPALYAEAAPRILAVHDALADGESKRQYAGAIAWRVLLDPTLIPEPRPERIYFDPDLLRLPDDAVIADVGAYAGDTLSTFLTWQGARFGAYHAFEPDPLSFARLLQLREKLRPDIAARISPRAAAIGAAPGNLFLTPTGTPGTVTEASAGTGMLEVPCVTLDAELAGGRVDYIKIDAEGAEAEVLAGAEAGIAAHRPSLGLSVYHAPSDIFTLPEWAMERLPGHSFHLRAHDHDGIDLVFYAVSPDHKP